uniref:Phospholipase A1 n=2 Tax=Opuntia streptacantha TaxID=393608 RepID=A0A7C9CY66_OPUST
MTVPQNVVLGQSGVTWKELLGAKNWEGLLNPLHDDLLRLILRCGDFCQVTYDTFIDDQSSKYCGASRYGKADLLHKTAFPDGADNYDVVGYLYATALMNLPTNFVLTSLSREKWDRESNWIGYVAVSNDKSSKEMGRREIYVAWRGTIRDAEWINDFGAVPESVQPLLSPNSKKSPLDIINPPRVSHGWLGMYTTQDPKSAFTKLSSRTQLMTMLKDLIDKYEGEDLNIIVCGHSLGAALAAVCAFDVAENFTSDIPVSAFLYCCPQVGNKAFRDRFESHPNLKAISIRNELDVVPRVPGYVLGYVDLGTMIEVDTRVSPYLKKTKNRGDYHNLQAVLHAVNGWHGEKGVFEPRIQRSLALVNKSSGLLKEEYEVPASWWVVQNKGMQFKDGDWFLSPPDDIPVPEF